MEESDPKIWLLVEDDENDFILFKRALRRVEPQAQVQWVRDGVEAKDYLMGNEPFADRGLHPLPSIILSDLKMPRCSGLELVQWVRKQPDLRIVPFIMFSSSDQPTDVGLAYEDGANWYLAKPGSFEGLVEMVGRLAETLATSVWRT